MSSANRCACGSNGPSRRSAAVGPPRQAAIAQPTVRGRSARYGSRRSRSARGSSGGCSAAPASAPTVPGSGCAERCTLPSAFSSRGACSARGWERASRGERGERAVEQLAVRVEQDADVVARQLDAGVAGRRRSPGCPAAATTSAPHAAASAGAAVARAGVDRHELRPRGEAGVDRAQQHRQLGGGVVQHDDDREGHGAPP